MFTHKVKIRNSIATRLMRIVFSFYIVFALLITLAHMFIEYNYQKTDVNRSLVEFEPSIQSTLAMNIWHMDDISLSKTMTSIIKIPLIVGITVSDETGDIIAAEGLIKDGKRSGLIDRKIDFLGIKHNGDLPLKEGAFNFDIFTHSFEVSYNHGGKRKILGNVILYSSSSVIFQRVKVAFLMLLINSILKTIALWFFFLYFSKKLLQKPLSSIADAVESINIDNIDKANVSISSTGKDELSFIEKSFNLMLNNLSEALKQRKQVEEQLLEQKYMYETLVDNVPGVTYRCKYDQDWTMVVISDEVFRITGYPASDFIDNKKRSYQSIIYIEDSVLADNVVKKSLEDKSSFTIEYRVVRSDGSLCWVYERGKCILNNTGEVDYIDGVIIDINDQKNAEMEIRKLRKYLSNIIDSMPSSLVGVDPKMKVTHWNKTIEARTGISGHQAIGKGISELLPYLKAEIDNISESIRTKTIKSSSTRKINDGESDNHEDITIYPLIANGVQGAVIRIDDVTDKIKLEEMLIQSEKMLSVGGLAAGMAHEINNPLAGMMQTANVMSNRLVEKPDMPANVKAAEKVGITTKAIQDYMKLRDIPRMMKTIIEAGNRASNIVSNMLSFARKGGGKKSEVDVNILIDETIDLALADYNIKGRFDFKKIEIIKHFSEGIPHIECDKSQIQQVLLNLLRNAAQAMHETRISQQNICIDTIHETLSNMITIQIKDNGPGMDADTVKRVFEPFFTTKSTGGGTGLGLSVSYFIITENHGGDMYVESKPGEGTKFTIKIPAIMPKELRLN